jgi:hypothetical protein
MKRITRLITQLQAAQATISKLIEQLELERDARHTDPVGHCLYCKMPIAAGERVLREMHEHCYTQARQSVLDGEETWDSLVEAGLAGAAKQGGRPRRKKTSMESKKKTL